MIIPYKNTLPKDPFMAIEEESYPEGTGQIQTVGR